MLSEEDDDVADATTDLFTALCSDVLSESLSFTKGTVGELLLSTGFPFSFNKGTKKKLLRMMYYPVSDTGILGKKI